MNTTILVIACAICLFSLPNSAKAAISWADQAKVLRVATAFLEALRVNDLVKLRALADPRSTMLEVYDGTDTFKQFMFIDRWRQITRLKNQSTPVKPDRLKINKSARWFLIEMLTASKLSPKSDRTALSTANTVLVAFDYLKGPYPVLLPVTKYNGSWYVASMPEWTTKFCEFDTPEALDAVDEEENSLVDSECYIDASVWNIKYPEGYTPPTGPQLTDNDNETVCRLVREFLEALRANDVTKMIAMSDPDSATGISLRSKNSVFVSAYLKYWRQILRLKKLMKPIKPREVYIENRKWNIHADIIKHEYHGGGDLSELTPMNSVVVVYNRDGGGVYEGVPTEALFPTRKRQGQWLVVGMPVWSRLVFGGRSLEISVKQMGSSFANFPKLDPKLVCPVDDKAAK